MVDGNGYLILCVNSAHADSIWGETTCDAQIEPYTWSENFNAWTFAVINDLGGEDEIIDIFGELDTDGTAIYRRDFTDGFAQRSNYFSFGMAVWDKYHHNTAFKDCASTDCGRGTPYSSQCFCQYWSAKSIANKDSQSPTFDPRSNSFPPATNDMCSGGSGDAVAVTSDGSETAPYISYGSNCRWGEWEQQNAALRLCEVAGYSYGEFVSSDCNLCESGCNSAGTSVGYHYIDANTGELKDDSGSYWKETGITATCYNSCPIPEGADNLEDYLFGTLYEESGFLSDYYDTCEEFDEGFDTRRRDEGPSLPEGVWEDIPESECCRYHTMWNYADDIPLMNCPATEANSEWFVDMLGYYDDYAPDFEINTYRDFLEAVVTTACDPKWWDRDFDPTATTTVPTTTVPTTTTTSTTTPTTTTPTTTTTSTELDTSTTTGPQLTCSDGPTWTGECKEYKSVKLQQFKDRYYSVDECANLCNGLDGCVGFQYGTNARSGWCLPVGEGCSGTGGNANWNFYDLASSCSFEGDSTTETPETSTDSPADCAPTFEADCKEYGSVRMAQYNGDYTAEQCAEICEGLSGCAGFQLGVGGKRAGDCLPVTAGCATAGKSANWVYHDLGDFNACSGDSSTSDPETTSFPALFCEPAWESDCKEYRSVKMAQYNGDYTPEQSAEICDGLDGCAGFQLGVGGKRAGDCLPVTAGCATEGTSPNWHYFDMGQCMVPARRREGEHRGAALLRWKARFDKAAELEG